MSRCVVTAYTGGRRLDLMFVPESARRRRQDEHRTARRGAVRGFSRQSRRRLMMKLASVNRLAFDDMPLFVTLTYHERWDHDWRSWKQQVRVLLKRLRYRYGKHSCLWRLEYQKRGAPHFHLLVFGMQPHEGFSDWIAHQWWDINGRESAAHRRYGTDVQRCNSWRQVACYLAKYLAKVPDKETRSDPAHGRVWGFEDQDELPVTPIQYRIALRDALRLRRVMRRVKGGRNYRPSVLQTSRCFLDEETWQRYRRACVQDETLLDRGG